MIWIEIVIYFCVLFLVTYFGFFIYGKSLLRLSKGGPFLKHIVGFIVYIIFALFILTPLYGVSLNTNWYDELTSNSVYSAFVLICYLLSAIPGFIFFHRRFIPELRKHGYFSKRE